MFKLIGKKIITILHPKSFPFEETIGPSRPEISNLNDHEMLQCAMVVYLLSGENAFGNYEYAKFHLNLHVTTMHTTKFQLNQSYHLGDRYMNVIISKQENHMT